MASQKVKNLLKLVLKIGVTAVCLWYISTKIHWTEPIDGKKSLKELFLESNKWWLVLAVLLFTVSKIISSYRLNVYFRNMNVHLGEKKNLKLYWLGMYYNLFLPGGYGGNGYKVYLVNKYRKNGIRKNIGAMLVNRISGLVAIGIITISLYYVSGIKIPYAGFAWILAPLLYGFYLGVMKYFFKSFLKIHARLFWWSMILQLMQLVSAYFILKAFHVRAEISDYLFLFFISAIATALPITIGGVGAREMVFLFGAKYLFLNYEIAISLSLMFFILSALLSSGGMYWVFFPPFRREPDPINIKDLETEDLTT